MEFYKMLVLLLWFVSPSHCSRESVFVFGTTISPTLERPGEHSERYISDSRKEHSVATTAGVFLFFLLT